MSTNKVEMSLDDIIKANKNKSAKNNRGGERGRTGRGAPQRKTRSFAPKAAGRGVQKRGKGQVVTPQRRNVNRLRKNFSQKSKPVTNKAAGPRTKNIGVAKATAVATQKLVQKLVKKALAQRNVRNTISTVKPSPSNIRRRGGVRLVKKTVILNRVSPKSRVINQRRRIQPAVVKTVGVRGRGPIRYNTNPKTVVQMISPSPIRRNFVPRQRNFANPRPIIIRQQPAQQRRGGQAYQLIKVPVNNRARTGSVRQQINAMRHQVVYTSPPQQQFRQQRRPQQFRQQRQPQVTYVQQQQPQRRRFQGNNNNRRNRGRQQNYSPFVEPQNYLQRIPVQQTTGGRRFVQ